MGTSQGLNLTVTATEEPGENHCRECGTKLGFFKRLANAEFCSDSHRAAYVLKLNEMGLARLRAAAGLTAQENKPSPQTESAAQPAAARGTAAA